MKNPFEIAYQKIPLERRQAAEQAVKEALRDTEVQEFLQKFDIPPDGEVVRVGRNEIMNFVRTRERDPHYIAKLQLINGHIYTELSFRQGEMVNKIRDKISTATSYDMSTSHFAGVALESIDINISNTRAISEIKQFLEGYSYGRVSKGIWLCGERGIGKSHLMGALATELGKRQVGVTYVGMEQLISDIKEMMNYNGSKLDQKIWQIQHESEVLILDDMGTEPPTNWNLKSVIYKILNYRMNHDKPTFFTSNLTKHQYITQLKNGKDIYPMDATRLESRLDSLAKEVQMGGLDRRDKA